MKVVLSGAAGLVIGMALAASFTLRERTQLKDRISQLSGGDIGPIAKLAFAAEQRQHAETKQQLRIAKRALAERSPPAPPRPAANKRDQSSDQSFAATMKSIAVELDWDKLAYEIDGSYTDESLSNYRAYFLDGECAVLGGKFQYVTIAIANTLSNADREQWLRLSYQRAMEQTDDPPFVYHFTRMQSLEAIYNLTTDRILRIEVKSDWELAAQDKFDKDYAFWHSNAGADVRPARPRKAVIKRWNYTPPQRP